MQGYFIVQSKRKLINVSAGEDMAANAHVSTPVSTPLEPLHAKVSMWYQAGHAVLFISVPHKVCLSFLDRKAIKFLIPMKCLMSV